MIKKFLLIFLIFLCSFSFAFAGDGSVSVNVPYSEPATGPTTGYITVYADSGKTYTYTWSFYGATKSTAFTQGGLTIGVVDGGDKLLIRMVEMNAENTVYGTLIRYGGGGVDILHSGVIDVTKSFTVNPTGNVTHYFTSGFIGSLSTDFDKFGRLDIQWGNTDYSSQLSSILSRLNNIRDNTNLTYEKIDLLYDLIEINYNEFISLFESFTIDSLSEFRGFSNTLSEIRRILNNWSDTTLENDDDLPSEDISNSIDKENEIVSGTDKSDSFDDVINSVDFGEFSGGFQLFWTLVDRLFATNPIFVILTVMCLSLGLISFIFNRR